MLWKVTAGDSGRWSRVISRGCSSLEQVDAADRPREPGAERAGVVAADLAIGLPGVVRQPDQPVGQPAVEGVGHVRPAVRSRQVDHPFDGRPRLEEEGLGEQAGARLWLEVERLRRAGEHRLPDGLAGRGDLGLRDQPAHAVPHQHHPTEGRIGAAWVEGLPGPVEVAAQQGRAALVEEVVARLAVGEGPELSKRASRTGSERRSLSICAKTRGVQCRPWTSTTGIFPGWYGSKTYRPSPCSKSPGRRNATEPSRDPWVVAQNWDIGASKSAASRTTRDPRGTPSNRRGSISSR